MRVCACVRAHMCVCGMLHAFMYVCLCVSPPTHTHTRARVHAQSSLEFLQQPMDSAPSTTHTTHLSTVRTHAVHTPPHPHHTHTSPQHAWELLQQPERRGKADDSSPQHNDVGAALGVRWLCSASNQGGRPPALDDSW